MSIRDRPGGPGGPHGPRSPPPAHCFTKPLPGRRSGLLSHRPAVTAGRGQGGRLQIEAPEDSPRRRAAAGRPAARAPPLRHHGRLLPRPLRRLLGRLLLRGGARGLHARELLPQQLVLVGELVGEASQLLELRLLLLARVPDDAGRATPDPHPGRALDLDALQKELQKENIDSNNLDEQGLARLSRDVVGVSIEDARGASPHKPAIKA